MIELRYVVPKRTSTQPPKLQYRYLVTTGSDRYAMNLRWTEWLDVPLVVLTGN